VALKYTCMLNGVTNVVMTKADVLDSFNKLNVCTEYLINGNTSEQVPFQLTQVNVKPTYKQFEGWNCDSTALKTGDNLPEAMQRYITFINQYIGSPVSHVSNGPLRDQIIKISN
jgi:adenylosuccinate synthase